MTAEAHPDALPAGYRLHWYLIERVLGQGGFGITYLANDTNLDRHVAIKEYLPAEIARRRSDASAQPHTESQSDRYAWGLERFLAEARTLARFDHPHIVRVYSVFEANNTAYMVMRFEEGENLATLLGRVGTLAERQLTDFLLPIVEGLELVHESGFIHRDIKPENIYVRRDGSPVLLDFGSARQSFGSSKTMTILVAPGYAPLEQYYGDASTQGAWTDIYALGATCYRAISGQPPLDAVARAKGVLGSAKEVLPPAIDVGRGRYDERLLAAVDHALQLNERDRPQTLAQWRREIVAPAAPAVPGGPVAAAPASAMTAVPAKVIDDTVARDASRLRSHRHLWIG
ncbi:MAG: serine/threonine protein kinase, partial [Aquincola sp.]|nr:serine/threonine protein kinase [Aquincola sp.]